MLRSTGGAFITKRTRDRHATDAACEHHPHARLPVALRTRALRDKRIHLIEQRTRSKGRKPTELRDIRGQRTSRIHVGQMRLTQIALNQATCELFVLGKPLHKHLGRRTKRTRQRLSNQRLLRVEVSIEAAHRHLCGTHDARHARPKHTLASHKPSRVVQKRLSHSALWASEYRIR